MFNRMTTTLLLLLCSSGLALADDRYRERGYDRREAIARAAHAVENASHHFYQQLRYDAGRGHLTKDAEKLARAANRFHRRVERGGKRSKLERDYDKLMRSYYHVSNEFRGQGFHRDRHFRRDFRQVERAMNNLERTLNGQRYGHASQRRQGYDRYDDRRHHDDHYDAGMQVLSLILDL